MQATVDFERDELEIIEVLRGCVRGCPLDVPVGVAIAAHQVAWACYEERGTDPGLAENAVRAILMARTATSQDYGEQFAYLTNLPIKAWPEMPSCPREQARHETLAGISSALKRYAN